MNKKSCRMGVFLLGWLLGFTGSASPAEKMEDFTAYQHQKLSKHEERFAEIRTNHPDDLSLEKFCQRLSLIEEVTRCLIQQFEAAKSSSLTDLLGDMVPGSPSSSVSSRTAATMMPAREIVRFYQESFQESLPLPDLPEAEIQILRDYYAAAAQAAGSYIAERGQAVIIMPDQNGREVMELCLVIPFLHVPDADWSKQQIQQLPQAMQGPSYWQMMEEFALSLQRPFTAYFFALQQRGPDQNIDYLSYLQATAEKLIHTQGYYPALCCLREGIAQADQNENQTFPVAITLHFRYAEVLNQIGHAQLAAEEMKTFLNRYPDHSNYGKAAMLRVKYLYEAGLYAEILQEGSSYLSQENCQTYLPQILYICWVTSRRENQQETTEEYQEKFLEQFPEHPLGADMYFASAMSALAASDYPEAERLLEIIEYRYPQSKILGKAKEIQERIKKISQ